MKMTTEQILKQIADLTADQLVATNSGTFGASDCHRAIGTGDTARGEWRTYERLDGSRYTTGCSEDRAPGYARYLSPPSLSSRRSQIASLNEAIKSSQAAARQQESQRESLARGWDGYQFIGIEAGKKKLAEMSAIA